MFGANSKERAYFAPFIAFLLLMALGSVVAHVGEGRALWVFSQTRYWVDPLQTLLCGVLLVRGWPCYDMQVPRGVLFTIGIGVLAFLLWIGPQEWLRAPQRVDGFNPEFFGATGWPYALNLGVRFLRLVVVVPLLEEVFWRGLLLRYLIDEEFTRVPIGTFSWLSFTVVTVGFCLEHSPADWPAAILTGALYNLVAYRTKSLSSCVLVHAITNALLGAYILYTRQWGFW
jgi:CAAX prenyl protease-like protein